MKNLTLQTFYNAFSQIYDEWEDDNVKNYCLDYITEYKRCNTVWEYEEKEEWTEDFKMDVAVKLQLDDFDLNNFNIYFDRVLKYLRYRMIRQRHIDEQTW